MSIAKIKLDEGAKLNFGVSITGAGGIPESRFVIENKDFSVSFPCTPTNEGVEVNIQGMANIFKAGTYDAHLEIVLENKIYRPLSDSIEFEPFVSISSKTGTVSSLKEAVKIEKVTVKTTAINEEILRRTQAATIIAKSLHYVPESTETPTEIINHAMEQSKPLTADQQTTLDQMLKLAESVDIEFDRSLIPETK